MVNSLRFPPNFLPPSLSASCESNTGCIDYLRRRRQQQQQQLVYSALPWRRRNVSRLAVGSRAVHTRCTAVYRRKGGDGDCLPGASWSCLKWWLATAEARLV